MEENNGTRVFRVMMMHLNARDSTSVLYVAAVCFLFSNAKKIRVSALSLSLSLSLPRHGRERNFW